MRENYFEILKELKNNRGENYYSNRSDTLKIGICKTKYPYIYCDTISFYEPRGIFFKKKTICQAYEDIIIGIEIKSQLDDGNRGDFSLINPLLKKELNIDFFSKFRKQMEFMINIYLMKPPK